MRFRSRILPSLATLAIATWAVAVRPVSPAPSPSSFLGYRTRATRKTAKFRKILGIRLTDGFEDGRFDLTAAGDFEVATAGGTVEQRTHLRAYKIKAVKGSPKHLKQLAVPVADDVGTFRLVDTVKPELLLVPTAEDPSVVPAPPDPNDPLDAYKCYRVKVTRKTAKLPKGLRTTVADPFTDVPKVFDVHALKHLCLPADRDGSGIQNPDLELACYTIKAAKGQPKHAARHALQLNNVFGPLVVDTVKESELCVPAEHPAPTPTPATTDGGATAVPTTTPAGTTTPTPLSTAAPNDPASVAPPLADGVVSVPALATSFLYTGADPIQTGVAPGTIDTKRAAVLRGKVVSTAGAPLAGVTVGIHDHPELGTTRTRVDGAYDLVVNGGGPLTLELQKAGLIPVGRRLEVPWQDFVMVPDVVMTALDPVATAITFGADAPFQTATSSLQSDADGTRRSLLLFPAGTSASLVFADGSVQPATLLHVRATELTVGGSGPAAMPAVLPPLSGYTYCTELSADEAITAGAVSVAFDQPVLAYTENFLDFPVGLAVPLGYFDRQRAVWVAEPNGRIVKIVAINGGVADVDTDGDGIADDGLGITSAEREALGAAYATGTSLWRMPTTHFTPVDGNNNIDTTGDTPPAENGAGPDQTDPIQKSCQNGGSIIECENQVLGESLAVIGTPYTLDYRSDRVPAQTATKTIRLSGASLPPTLASIDLHLAVAGRSFDQSFPATPNQATTFTWDRMDAYGRQLIGGQTLAVTIDYNYPAVYQEPGPFPEAFNQTGGTTLGLNPSRQQVSLSDHFTTMIGEGLTDARTIGLGGWSLDVHHVYDPVARVLHAGGGTRRRAGSLARLLSTIDLPGQSVLFDVATGPDGSVYVALPHGDQIIRVAPDGTQTVVAGNGVEGFDGDGGPATAAELGDPTGVAVAADGTILIAEEGNRRVRKVALDGTISTIAGTGVGNTSTGDGGQATQATFTTAERIAVGPDGSIYLVDGGTRIRRLTTDGIIRTVAGTGTVGGTGDGGPATSATLNCASVSAAADGGFYVADFFNHRVRRVRPDGIITTVADYTADLGQPVSVRPAPDGGLLIAVSFASARTPEVDLLRTDGTLATIAGGGPTPVRDGIPATQANLAEILATAVGPDGSLYLVRGGSDSHVVRVSPALPGFTGDDIVIASDDGSELYVFDQDGRHRRTLLALTGAVLREFGYDGAGRLATITEKTGGTDDVTTIQHDASGNPTAIVGPFGQVTTLAVDANGFLASVTNPAGEARTLTSSPDGLLESLSNPRGKTTTFTYDGDGRLLSDADPIGGSQTLARTSGVDQFTVTRTTTLGRVTTHDVVNLAGDVQERTITDPDGAVHHTSEDVDAGTIHTTFPDGSTMATMLGPDPRFGMQAPITALNTIAFPTSPAVTLTSTRTATLADAHDPLSLTSETTAVTLGGDITTTTYDAATRTFTATSPTGRTDTLTVDALGRFVTAQLGTLAPKHATYDAHGRLTTLTSGTGPSARTLTYTYDAAGFLATITDPLGHSASLAHDPVGRVTSETLPSGTTLAFSYDAAGNLTSLTPPGRPTHTLVYSDRNELTLITPPAVPGTGTLGFAYDADGAVTTITRSGTDAMTIGYDAFGRPTTRTQDLGGPPLVDTFAYDSAGRLASVTAASGAVITYTYDGLLSVGETLAGPVAGSVTRTYDGALRIASQTVAGTPTIAYAYDADSQILAAGDLALAHDANGLVTTETLGVVSDSAGYDAFGDLASYTASANATPVYAEALTRDADARIVQKVETIGPSTTTYAYTYDLAGQLTTVEKDGDPFESYTYDDNGNRSDATVDGVHASASTDDQDRLTQYGTTSFTYTPAGDLESKTIGAATTTYEYDVLGNLLAVTLPDATAITYVVDGQGRRVGKKVNDTLVQGLLYDDVLRPVAELDGGGTIVSRFVYTGGTVPAYLVKGGVAFRIISDSIGSVRLVVNATTGDVAQRLDYDSFGRVTQDTNPGFQPFGFAGGLYDPDTKLTRFGVRDYDATVGRFTAKDQAAFAGGDPNLYRYALNDPIDINDPTGLDWLDTLAGFSDRLRADSNLAANPVLLLDVTVDSLVRLGAAELGFDPGETLYDQLFVTKSPSVDPTSGDYLDGQFYAQCVDLAAAVLDVAGEGVSSAVSSLDRTLSRRAARLAQEEAAKQAAENAGSAGERAMNHFDRNMREINPRRVRAENGNGNVNRGRNIGGGYTRRGG